MRGDALHVDAPALGSGEPSHSSQRLLDSSSIRRMADQLHLTSQRVACMEMSAMHPFVHSKVPQQTFTV